VEVFPGAVALLVRSIALSAQSAGQQRLLWWSQSAAMGGELGAVARLRDENRRLKSENRLLKSRLDDAPSRRRYTPVQRLQILWHMAYYGMPRSRVTLIHERACQQLGCRHHAAHPILDLCPPKGLASPR